MQTTNTPSLSQRRGWLASLLLRRSEGFLPRLAAAVRQWRNLPRRLRRRLQRKVAAAALGAALIFGLAGGAFLTPTAHAATINVDDNTVAVDGNDGLCSLLEAIINANNDSAMSAGPGECIAGSGADTINLPANGNFILTDYYDEYYYSDTGLPLITSEITVEGNGSTISRENTAPYFRIMAINGAGTVTLNDVVISGGHTTEDGGGIYLYDGKLTINDSTITDNFAYDDGGGIEVDGTENASKAVLTLNNTLVTYNFANEFGGGLAQEEPGLTGEEGGQITISNSTFYENDAEYGGGIFIQGGELDLTESTITNNYAIDYGGGLYIDDYSSVTITSSFISGNLAENDGGGVHIDDSTVDIIGSTISGNYAEDGGGVYMFGDTSDVTITNTTISDNTAYYYGGGIYQDSGLLTLNNVTITANTADYKGGGIYRTWFSDILWLYRSIVSGNTAPAGAEMFFEQVLDTYSRYNVLGHAGLLDTEAFYSFVPQGTDVEATSNYGNIPLTDILDTTLADNGGPTLTHNLVSGSPAIDMAPDADCAADPTGGLDQRGFARPFDILGEGNDAPDTNTCDAGAVEYASAPADSFIYMSAKKSGTTSAATGGVDFDNSDILKWDGTNWMKIFDGTDAHLDPVNKPKHNVNAFWVDPDTDEIIMSFAQNGRKVFGITSKVDGMDLVKWDGSGFSLWFDGSDVGLTKKTPEKIDGLHILPGTAAPSEFGGACEFYLLVSTQGNGAVPAYPTGQIKFGGEDILGFCLTNWGEATDGFWHMVLDGSTVGVPKNSLDSISSSADGTVLYFTTSKAVNLGGGVAGGHSMIYAYDGSTFSGPLFIAANNGLGQKVDGLHVAGELE